MSFRCNIVWNLAEEVRPISKKLLLFVVWLTLRSTNKFQTCYWLIVFNNSLIQDIQLSNGLINVFIEKEHHERTPRSSLLAFVLTEPLDDLTVHAYRSLSFDVESSKGSCNWKCSETILYNERHLRAKIIEGPSYVTSGNHFLRRFNLRKSCNLSNSVGSCRKPLILKPSNLWLCTCENKN